MAKIQYIILFLVGILCVPFVNAALCGGNITCACAGTLNESYVIMQDLTCHNTSLYIINQSNLVLDCNASTLSYARNSSGYAVYTSSSHNITIKHCTFVAANRTNNESIAVYASNSTRLQVINSTFLYGTQGFFGQNISSSILQGNNFSNFTNTALTLKNSNTTNITYNRFENASLGIYMINTSLSKIWDNFFNTTSTAREVNTSLIGLNEWYLEYSCLATTRNILADNCTAGNFWNNYLGADDGSGPSAPADISGDGVGDTLVPYTNNNNITSFGDNLPLVFVNYPATITNITLLPKPTYTNSTLNVTVTITDDFHTTPHITFNWSRNGITVNTSIVTLTTAGNYSTTLASSFFNTSDNITVIATINDTVNVPVSAHATSSISNSVPMQNRTIANISLTASTSTTLTLREYFYDVDEDTLTYTSSSSLLSFVNETLTITASSATGTTTAIINATDGTNTTQSNNFTITVTAIPVSSSSGGSSSSSQKRASSLVVSQENKKEVPIQKKNIQKKEKKQVIKQQHTSKKALTLADVEKNYSQVSESVYAYPIVVLPSSCLQPTQEKLQEVQEETVQELKEHNFSYEFVADKLSLLWVVDKTDACYEVGLHKDKKTLYVDIWRLRAAQPFLAKQQFLVKCPQLLNTEVTIKKTRCW